MLSARPVRGGRRSGGFPVVSLADFEKCADFVGGDGSSYGLVVSAGIASGAHVVIEDAFGEHGTASIVVLGGRSALGANPD